MTPQGWNPQSGMPPIPIESNIYIMQVPTEVTKNNEENNTGNRAITSKN